MNVVSPRVRCISSTLVSGIVAISLLPVAGGCPGTGPVDPGLIGPSIFYNTTDPTNRGASYIGSATCTACHPTVAAAQSVHGHSQQLKPGTGLPPVYPSEGHRAGVPAPPANQPWTNIAYVIGGYLKGARFIDQNGFIQTNASVGADAEWSLAFPPNGNAASFAPFETGNTSMPYVFDCFRCHTTGPMAQDPADPLFQDGRPGIVGTWSEPAVTCEACHGPGSNHVRNPGARTLYVSSAAASCGVCHTEGDNPDVIPAANGFVSPYSQYPELLASGGHAAFQCTICHDPHASSIYDRARGIRNNCMVCHGDQNMALHDGAVFVRGDYSEVLTCESCHMPYAARYFSSATTDVVGPSGRVGDTRSHIFRISSDPAGYPSMFSADGASVVKDADGRAAVTVDFVCLRCHNGIGNVFNLTTARAAEIAPNVHETFE